MAAIYRDLAADNDRTRQVIADVLGALARGGHRLVLTLWIAQLRQLEEGLEAMGHDPVLLRGGSGAKSRTSALAHLRAQPGGLQLLVVATAQYAGEGFDLPAA
jgi:hypothetical protein